MRKLHYLLFAMIMGLSISLTSCSSDDDDAPIVPGVKFPDVKGTLTNLKALAIGTDGVGVEIPDEIILEGTVVSNPATKNLPKGLFIQVGDAAIKLSVDDSGTTFTSLQVGQRVFIKAQGLYIGVSYNVPVLGEGSNKDYKVGLISDDKLKEILIIDTKTVKEVTPKVVTLADIESPLAMVGTVVSIEGVQFIEDDKAKSYFSGDRSYTTTNLIDKEGNKIAISTYKTATFGAEAVKGANSGTVTAILSIFGGKPQLILRSENDLAFATARFEEPQDPNPTTDSKVYFSEYYEGASFDKYVEIYNGTDADINLANYTVRPAMNGGDWNAPVALEGTLPVGKIFIVCHTSASEAIKAKAGLQNEDVCNFNGDDAVGLFVKVDAGWSLCDVIGVPGTKKDWTVGKTENGAKDHTLIRKETITVGNPDWTTATNEWDVKDKGYSTSYGIRGEGDVVNPEAPEVNKTVAEIQALVTGDAVVKISEEFAFDGVVTSNQGASGNFYKAIYVQDETGAIKISCDKGTYESYNIGQNVVVDLKGKFVGKKDGTYLIGSAEDSQYVVAAIPDAEVATTVVKVEGNATIQATTVTIDALTEVKVGKLVKFEAVQVLTADLAKLITDGLMLVDAAGNKIKLYVSSYASGLKNIATPQKSGSISGVLFKSGDAYSLTLRLESEIEMTADRFDDGSTTPEVSNGINAGTYTGSAATKLFISEYVEPDGGNHKIIEIFNGTGADVDLSAYSLAKDSNGNNDFSSTVLALEGTLPNGGVLVIGNKDTDTSLLPDGVEFLKSSSSVFYFNGDDQVVLKKADAIIDRVGKSGDVNFGKNVTLIRKETVKSPNAAEAMPADNNEWTVVVNSKNAVVLTNIGTHTFTPTN